VGRRLLWDNSNIIESYHGLTGPLTYSFASSAYTIVYRLFCEVMGVPSKTIQDNSEVFGRMIGLIRGRIYYNLDAWYRVVSMLPGYQWNREFLEGMMGVSDVADKADPETSSRSLSDLGRLLRTMGGLLWRQVRMDKDVARFTGEFELAMAAHDRELGGHEPHVLIEIYGDLERRLLWAWSTPIVNDFFVMIFHGLLGRLCEKWLPEAPHLHNALLAGEGGLMSAAPAVEAMRLAKEIRQRSDWHVVLRSPVSDAEAYALAAQTPALRAAIDRYLDDYGDRCVDELKLETPSLRDEPGRFIATLRAYLAAPPQQTEGLGRQERTLRLDAEAEARAGLGPLRGPVFRWVLSQARKRVRDRENLRFLRTRIFGRVRDIFVALGRHMHRAGALADHRDVFWLTTEEVFGWVRGTAVTTRVDALTSLRKAEYAEWATQGPPADRFQTWGPVWADNLFLGRPRPPSDEGLSGLSAFPGVVEGRVVRVTDPDNAGDVDGAVVVAYRTDPGWVPLFPRLAALVVERGSLLSHSAVVARELGIPTVVAVSGVMSALQDGDQVRVDATSGEIILLERPE
jgi:pyruvate,water dikinase